MDSVFSLCEQLVKVKLDTQEDIEAIISSLEGITLNEPPKNQLVRYHPPSITYRMANGLRISHDRLLELLKSLKPFAPFEPFQLLEPLLEPTRSRKRRLAHEEPIVAKRTCIVEFDS